MIAEEPDKVTGPFRVEDLLAIWNRIARMAHVLHGAGQIRSKPDELRALIAAAALADEASFEHPDLNRTLGFLAAPDAMFASDWVRMKVIDARGQTNVAAHALDLRGLRCRRLVIRFTDGDACRVTIHNRRGDVVSVDGHNLANALGGAIRMAGARPTEGT